MEKLEFIKENKENKMVKLIYILNNNPEKITEMKLMLISNNINNKELNAISYGEIEYSFLKFLEQKDKEENEEKQLNNIDYKYIGYSTGNGFIKLQKRDFIFLEKDLNKFKIKIIANILNREEKYIKYKQYKIEKEIENIDTKLVSFKKNIRKNPFNLIVLIANPLIHKRNELRTMNDFNIIPANIYNLLKEKDFLKYADFQPLTIKTFKDAINKRPDILHLICKSTYSSNLVNLIFENDKEKYNADFINKEMIDEIFSEKEMRECVKNMTLIISTPLAEDVYNMFQFEGFKFKNILVEHTTLANLDLVTEFNLLFYFDLIYTPLNMINNIYEDAMNISFSKKCNTFCCCFHKHKNGCELMINSINELYNDKLIYKLTKLEDLKRIIPHFCHLISECPDNTNKKCEDFNDFCIHYSFNHQKYFKFNPKIKELGPKVNKNKINTFVSNCCCYEENRIHNINSIFFKHFDKSNSYESFNENKIIKFYMKDNYIPQFEKMKLLVGKNSNVFEIIKFINTDDKYLYNIYGDNIENLKILGNIVIEYYKERYNLYTNDKKNIKEIESIDINDYKNNNFGNEFVFNKIYFIYDYLEDINQLSELIDKKGIITNKIILFSGKKINSDKINGFKEIIPEPLLKTDKEYQKLKEYIPNEYIKFQHDYTVRNIWE